MALDVPSVMLVGVLLSVLTVVLLAQAGHSLPVERRRHLRIWTVGLVLQPVSWALLAARGAVPDVVAIPLGNGLLLLGFAEMCRAMRGFHGLPERAWTWWNVVLVAVGLQALLAAAGPHYSHRVLVNSTAVIVLLAATALALTLAPSFRRGGFSAARLTAAFVVVGVVIAGWRFVEHLLWPRSHGSLLDAGASDVAVFGYACVGVMFLSLGFVLMHTERAYEELRRFALLDALTGVLGRSGIVEHGARMLSEARRHERPLSALLIDLDEFKGVNDRLGHAAGDRLLRHLAERARQVLRGEDLLGRLGGDEFVALLPSTDAAGATVVAERLRAALGGQALALGEARVAVRLSIGVAAADAGMAGFDALLEAADAAMYRAKRAGGDRIEVAPAAAGTIPG